MSFNQSFDIKASAYKIFPSSRFVIWNCDDLTDHGIVRFGDAVWLQVSETVDFSHSITSIVVRVV